MADGRVLVVTHDFEVEGWSAVDGFPVDEERRGRPPRWRRELTPEERAWADVVRAELDEVARRLARELRDRVAVGLDASK